MQPFLIVLYTIHYMPIRKKSTKKEKKQFEQCVDDVFEKTPKHKRETYKLGDSKYNPWAICNATVFRLLKTQQKSTKK